MGLFCLCFLHNNIVILCETLILLSQQCHSAQANSINTFGEEKGEEQKYSSELPGSFSLCETGARPWSGHKPSHQTHQLTFNTGLIAVSLSSCLVAAAQWKKTFLVGSPLEIPHLDLSKRPQGWAGLGWQGCVSFFLEWVELGCLQILLKQFPLDFNVNVKLPCCRNEHLNPKKWPG